MRSEFRHGFALGDFHVRPLQGEVRGPKGTTHLQPKAVEVLLCLAETRGDLVSRDELLRCVWGDGAGNNALTHCISELRHAFDDQRNNPRYIQTVPKRGYRLVGVAVPDHGERAPVQTAEARSPVTLPTLWQELKQRNVVRVAIAYSAISWLLLQVAEVMVGALQLPDWSLPVFLFVLGLGFLVAVVVAWAYQIVPEKGYKNHDRRARVKQSVDLAIIGTLVVGVGFLFYRHFVDQPLFPEVANLPATMTAPEPREHSVAVLRFDNFGGNSAFSNGLSEHLLNLLARVPGLEVPSRTVSWMLSDQELDPRAIAESLRVRYLLEGSVQQQDERIRVTAQLIDGASGNHVWSESYDEVLSAENFFNIQDRIAGDVVQRLELTFYDDFKTEISGRHTHSDDALRFYLVGRAALNEPKSTESLTDAVTAFEASIKHDPHFAEAFSGLCQAHLGWYVTYQDTEHFEAAEAACTRALRINKSLGEVYAAMGSLHFYSGQYEEAEAELLQARKLLQDSAPVLEDLGKVYRAQNKLVLAERTFHEAIEKDPANWSVYKSMGNFLFRTGRYQDALPYYKQVTVMERDSAAAYNNLASAFFMLGNFGSATIAWRQSLDLEPTHTAYMNLGNSLYYQGRFEESVAVYRKAINLGGSDARVWGSLAASCRYASGEEQCAADAYSRAIELINESLAINPSDADALSRLATYLARSGRSAEAREALMRVEALNWDDPNIPYFVAQALLALGDTDAALSELKRAIVLGYPKVLLAGDPGLSDIRQHTDFVELSQNRLR